MRQLVIPFAMLVCAALALSSALDFFGNHALDEVDRELRRAPSELLYREAKTLLESARNAETVFLDSGEASFAASLAYRRVARNLPAGDSAQLDYLCLALAAMGRAVQAQPYKSRYLIHWADLRRVLSNFNCKREYTAGDVDQVLKFAVDSDPTNPAVLYAAAIMSRPSAVDSMSSRLDPGAAEDPRLAGLDLVRRYLELGGLLNDSRYDALLSNVVTAEQLDRAIPGQFPVVNWFVRAVHRHRPELLELTTVDGRQNSFLRVLVRKQAEALKRSESSFQRGELPLDVHRDRISKLMQLGVRGSIRHLADVLLSRVLRRDGAARFAEYLAARSELSDLDFVVGAREADSRPMSGVLSGWSGVGTLTFDNFYSSVGFYLPALQSVQLIELQSRGSTWSLDPSDIVLYVSSDNQDWREFEQDYQVRMHSANGLSLVALHLPQSYHKYWKVSYRSSERNKRFVNSMDRLLRVYGRNARTQGRSQAAAKG